MLGLMKLSEILFVVVVGLNTLSRKTKNSLRCLKLCLNILKSDNGPDMASCVTVIS